MNGNELLWPRGERRGALDASLAAEDLELNRLSLLLFPSACGRVPWRNCCSIPNWLTR